MEPVIYGHYFERTYQFSFYLLNMEERSSLISNQILPNC